MSTRGLAAALLIPALLRPPVLAWEVPERDYWPTREWRVSAPEAEGMDAGRLARLDDLIAGKHPEVRGLVIVRRGRIVFERHYGGDTPTTVYNVKSVSKSILSALVGIARSGGMLQDLDLPLADYFPEHFGQGTDPRKKKITVRHLLTMAAGLEWDELGPGVERWFHSKDLVKATLDAKLVSEPGTAFHYSTALSHVLAVLLERVVKADLRDYADKRLFAPIGLKLQDWMRDPRGHRLGGSEMHMTVRDMARFGFLYLNGGRWDGKQIVPSEWIRESARSQAPGPAGREYGYLWWVSEYGGLPVLGAQGYGGQLICVLPALDLVVVVASTTDGSVGGSFWIVKDHVLPAVRAASENGAPRTVPRSAPPRERSISRPGA